MQLGWSDEGEVRPPSPSQAPSLRLQAVHGTPPSARICGQTRLWSVFIVSTCSDVIILFPAMISGIFERTMKRRGVRESDPFDWEKVSFLHERHDNYHRDNNRQEMITTTIITLNPGWERQHSERRDRFRKPSGQDSAATK